MAGAIIGGILRSGMASPADVIGAEPGEARRRELSGSLGIQMTASNKEAAEAAEILFLTVKPQFLGDVIAEIRDCVNQGQVLVSIVAGKSTGWIEEHFGEEKGLRIVRLMPNTPALVGEGMTAVCKTVLKEIDRKRLVFDVLVTDDAGIVAKGTHERFIIDNEKFLKNALKRAGRDS